MKTMRRQYSFCWQTLLAGVVLTFVGCTRQDDRGLVEVSGAVTVDGKPLRTGSVSFRPIASRGNKTNHIPTCSIDAEGSFNLKVPPETSGAPLGWYKVVIVALDDPRPGHLVPLINKKFMDVKTTPLEIEVIKDPEPGHYEIKVTR